jgi:transposase InsO family protein
LPKEPVNVVITRMPGLPFAEDVDTSLGGARVVNVLERLAATRGLPEAITMDNGPEFAGRHLDEWAFHKGVKLNFIRPGKPIENAFAESFNGRPWYPARCRRQCKPFHRS